MSSLNRRGMMKAGSLAMLAAGLSSWTRTTAEAKDKPGGFGATASVSVNSGNNSGNQTFQENQAILTMDSAGNIQVQQGNANGGTVQQGAVASSPAIQPADGQCGCDGPVPAGCEELSITIGDKGPVDYIPVRCLPYYCTGGS